MGRLEFTGEIRRRSGDCNQQLFHALVLDEFEVVPDRFPLPAASKLEHNTYTGQEQYSGVLAVKSLCVSSHT